jgi:hypothetical protein
VSGSETGVVLLSTGTTSAGAAAVTQGVAGYRAGAGDYVYAAIIEIPTLADGTDDYDLWLGFGTEGVAFHTEPTNGFYAAYMRSAYGTTWHLRTASASSRSQQDSGITVVAATKYLVVVTLNAGRTTASLSVNGSTPVTLGTNIPATTVPIVPFARIAKSAGSTARTLRLDRIGYELTFTTPRA